MPRIPCVLLVDDHATTRFLQRRALQRLAAIDDLREAESYADALGTLLSLHGQLGPATQALIVLDAHLPGAQQLLTERTRLGLLPQAKVVCTRLEPEGQVPRPNVLVLPRPLAFEALRPLLDASFA